MLTKVKTVSIIFGGKSPEHEISIKSASFVVKNLLSANIGVQLIYINKNGEWFHNDVEKNFHQDILYPEQNTSIKLNLADINSEIFAEIAIIMLHGINGEDGRIQGMLELFDIPYTGCDLLSSALANNKYLSKKLVSSISDINVAPEILLTSNCINNIDFYINEINQLGYPVFIKPINLGSSIGVFRLDNEQNLRSCLKENLPKYQNLMVEKAIFGREIEVAVLEDENDLITEAGEIIIQKEYEFYDYNAKYMDPNGAKLSVPAKLNEANYIKVCDLAKLVFKKLGCCSMARVDFFLEEKTGKFYFNELNIIPGFTSISLFPKLMQFANYNPKDIILTLINTSLNRFIKTNNIMK